MHEIKSEILFNRAVLFLLFAFECDGRQGKAFFAISVALAICAVCNIGKSLRAFMEDE